mmetsp:Transcript_25335/g.37408  ORF Transcript_25335/g.37408 Transcript_25335/m.37408 type:complete len:247 (-) Transcript_25335:1141-1881(-)
MENKRSAYSRESSFARDFYQNANDGGGADAETHYPVPKGRPRRMSRRQSSKKFAAVPECATNLKKLPPQTNSFDEVDYGKIIEESERSSETGFGGLDDEEVLEQYRIMAQHEANFRVKENTGFDIAEYEKRRKMQGEERKGKKILYGNGKKSKTRLPEPKKFHSSPATPKIDEPPVPIPKMNSKFVEQTQTRIPELCPGVMGGDPADDEHVVRCLGCRGQVKVKILATLVSCPECHTVSPASSTRR